MEEVRSSHLGAIASGTALVTRSYPSGRAAGSAELDDPRVEFGL